MQDDALNQFDPNTFEHFVNELALEVLGAGATGFGPGADGGRDGWFEGKAPYPSEVECWDGVWYVQSKFHAPNLSGDPQKWLVEQVRLELEAFQKPHTRRRWPANWIIATNIDPSGVPDSGAFDRCRALVLEAKPALAKRFAIWGGKKLLALAGKHKHVAERHAHLLTPGHVLTEIYSRMQGDRASKGQVIDTLIARGLADQRYTKLDQAGSLEDPRAGIHELYVDLPYKCGKAHDGLALAALCTTSARNHSPQGTGDMGEEWERWQRSPRRSKIWFVKGGPGQGKSTIGQVFCQIQRAALLPGLEKPRSDLFGLAKQIGAAAGQMGAWPIAPRVPIYVELKKYSQWFGERDNMVPRGVESYLSSLLGAQTQQPVSVGGIRELIAVGRWVIVFDGLDEVPSAVKDLLADEIREFVLGPARQSDILTLCTSRPQGYSGQFDSFCAADVQLLPLPATTALDCARRVAAIGRNESEVRISDEILEKALKSGAVAELMTTPLQAHIIAVIVRSGQHPPERKWELYRRFYEVILARESAKGFPDGTSELLRGEGVLIKAVHNRLGFVLHSDAERAAGALASLPKSAFRTLVAAVVREKKGEDAPELTERIMVAATDRLVLINTPEEGTAVRFDIRQIQEFFAAEFLYDGIDQRELAERVRTVGGDAHWREVMHFVLSALAETNRRPDLSAALRVLEQLDDSHELAAERTLARFLARGAVVAAGLLADGVLEQDHGVRNLFWKALEPLSSARDSRAIDSLLNVEGEMSRRWLCGFMIDALERHIPGEGIGALRILWRLLRDGDTEVERIRKNLKASRFVTLHLAATPWLFDDSIEIKGWQAETLVDALSEPGSASSWWQLRRAMSRSSTGVLLDALAARHGEEWRALPELYASCPSSEATVSFGVFTLSPLVKPAVDAAITLPVRSSWPASLQALSYGLAYVRSESNDDLGALLDCLNDDWRNAYLLPSHWVLPVSRTTSPRELRDRLRGGAPSQLEAVQREGGVFAMRGRLQRVGKGELVRGMRELLSSFPDALPRIIGDLSDDEFRDEAVAETLRNGLHSRPEFLDTLDPRVWGYLITDAERPNLRQASRDGSYWNMVAAQVTGAAFELRLPDDSPLLVRVLQLIFGPHSTRVGSRMMRMPLADVLGRFGLEREALASVARAESQATENERVAAVLLSLVLPDCVPDGLLREFGDLLVTAATRGNPLVEELGRCGAAGGCLEMPEFRVVASRVLREFGRSSAYSIAWDEAITGWRERSTAPSLSHGARDRWCDPRASFQSE